MDKGKAMCQKSTCPFLNNTQQQQQQPPQPQQPQQQPQQYQQLNVSNRNPRNPNQPRASGQNYYQQRQLQQQQQRLPNAQSMFDDECYFDCRGNSNTDINARNKLNYNRSNVPQYNRSNHNQPHNTFPNNSNYSNNSMTSRNVHCNKNSCSFYRLNPQNNNNAAGTALPNKNRMYNGKLADAHGSHCCNAANAMRAPGALGRQMQPPDGVYPIASRTRLVIRANVIMSAQSNPDKYTLSITPATIEIPLEIQIIPPSKYQNQYQTPIRNTESKLIHKQCLLPHHNSGDGKENPPCFAAPRTPPPSPLGTPKQSQLGTPPHPPIMNIQALQRTDSLTDWKDLESDSSYDREAPPVKKKPQTKSQISNVGQTIPVCPTSAHSQIPNVGQTRPASPTSGHTPAAVCQTLAESSEGSMVSVESEATQTPTTLLDFMKPSGAKNTLPTQTSKTGIALERDDPEYLKALQEMSRNNKPSDKVYSSDMSQKMKPPIPPKPKPKKYRLAYPQHKDLDLCTKCRFDPSPLIDEGGNVFCPGNCGCCLCPWITRPTPDQQVEMRHKKVRVCKCRERGTILTDFDVTSHCSNISFYDLCPCRDKAEHKHLELYDIPMGEDSSKVLEKEGEKEIYLTEVVEISKNSKRDSSEADNNGHNQYINPTQSNPTTQPNNQQQSNRQILDQTSESSYIIAQSRGIQTSTDYLKNQKPFVPIAQPNTIEPPAQQEPAKPTCCTDPDCKLYNVTETAGSVTHLECSCGPIQSANEGVDKISQTYKTISNPYGVPSRPIDDCSTSDNLPSNFECNWPNSTADHMDRLKCMCNAENIPLLMMPEPMDCACRPPVNPIAPYQPGVGMPPNRNQILNYPSIMTHAIMQQQQEQQELQQQQPDMYQPNQMQPQQPQQHVNSPYAQQPYPQMEYAPGEYPHQMLPGYYSGAMHHGLEPGQYPPELNQFDGQYLPVLEQLNPDMYSGPYQPDRPANILDGEEYFSVKSTSSDDDMRHVPMSGMPAAHPMTGRQGPMGPNHMPGDRMGPNYIPGGQMGPSHYPECPGPMATNQLARGPNQMPGGQTGPNHMPGGQTGPNQMQSCPMGLNQIPDGAMAQNQIPGGPMGPNQMPPGGQTGLNQMPGSPMGGNQITNGQLVTNQMANGPMGISQMPSNFEVQPSNIDMAAIQRAADQLAQYQMQAGQQQPCQQRAGQQLAGQQLAGQQQPCQQRAGQRPGQNQNEHTTIFCEPCAPNNTDCQEAILILEHLLGLINMILSTNNKPTIVLKQKALVHEPESNIGDFLGDALNQGGTSVKLKKLSGSNMDKEGDIIQYATTAEQTPCNMEELDDITCKEECAIAIRDGRDRDPCDSSCQDSCNDGGAGKNKDACEPECCGNCAAGVEKCDRSEAGSEECDLACQADCANPDGDTCSAMCDCSSITRSPKDAGVCDASCLAQCAAGADDEPSGDFDSCASSCVDECNAKCGAGKKRKMDSASKTCMDCNGQENGGDQSCMLCSASNTHAGECDMGCEADCNDDKNRKGKSGNKSRKGDDTGECESTCEADCNKGGSGKKSEECDSTCEAECNSKRNNASGSGKKSPSSKDCKVDCKAPCAKPDKSSHRPSKVSDNSASCDPGCTAECSKPENSSQKSTRASDKSASCDPGCTAECSKDDAKKARLKNQNDDSCLPECEAACSNRDRLGQQSENEDEQSACASECEAECATNSGNAGKKSASRAVSQISCLPDCEAACSQHSSKLHGKGNALMGPESCAKMLERFAACLTQCAQMFTQAAANTNRLPRDVNMPLAICACSKTADAATPGGKAGTDKKANMCITDEDADDRAAAGASSNASVCMVAGQNGGPDEVGPCGSNCECGSQGSKGEGNDEELGPCGYDCTCPVDGGEDEDDCCICGSSNSSSASSSCCDCCHCRALRRCKDVELRKKPSVGDTVENNNNQMKMFIDSLLMDMEAMDATRRGPRPRPVVSTSTPPKKSILSGDSFPVCITEVRALGVSSIFVKWIIHDCYNIAGYEIYVDGCLTNRYFNAKHEAAVICDIDPCLPHKIVLIAQPQTTKSITLPPNAGNQQNMLMPKGNDNDCSCWTPSVFYYEGAKAQKHRFR